MNKVLISKEVPRIAYELLAAEGFQVETLKNDVSLASLTETELAGVEGIITMLSDAINEDFLKKTNALKVVTNFAVGFNNLDISALQKRKILIGNTPEVLTEATAELAVSLLLMSNRNLYQASKSVYEGAWSGFHPLEFLGPTLFRKKIGIFGFGRIGKKISEILHYGFQCPIAILDRGEEKNLDAKKNIHFPLMVLDESEFLSSIDALIIIAPLTSETKHWLNKKRLKLLKPDISIVNVARGDLVEENDIIEFLKNSPSARFATDVMSVEPLPLQHEFMRLKNITLLPHIGSASIEARNEMAKICAKNIIMGIKQGKIFRGPMLK